jgi:hypothetical protein
MYDPSVSWGRANFDDLKSNRAKNERVVDYEASHRGTSVDAAQENAHTLVDVEMSSNMRLLFMSFI